MFYCYPIDVVLSSKRNHTILRIFENDWKTVVIQGEITVVIVLCCESWYIEIFESVMLTWRHLRRRSRSRTILLTHPHQIMLMFSNSFSITFAVDILDISKEGSECGDWNLAMMFSNWSIFRPIQKSQKVKNQLVGGGDAYNKKPLCLYYNY